MVDRSLAHATNISVGRQMRFKSKLVKTSFVQPYYSFPVGLHGFLFPTEIEPWTEGGSFVKDGHY